MGVWRYLLFDPKHLRRIENDDYHETLSTPISDQEPLINVINWVHAKYPTALIDDFEFEEEMLRNS